MNIEPSSVQKVGTTEILDAPARTRYADAIVKAGVALRRGDFLLLQTQPQHRELAIAIAESAYRHGARHVELEVSDRLLSATRFRAGGHRAIGGYAPWLPSRGRALLQPDAAMIGIRGEGDPDALAGIDPKLVAAHEQASRKPIRSFVEGVRSGRVRWALAGWPTEEWAKLVYPELPALDAQRRLAGDLLSFCRLTTGDGEGIAGWVTHVKMLEARARKLTRLKLERLELRGPGTELQVVIAPGTIWRGGRERTTSGHLTSPNMPTEEVFTSPAPPATAGTFRCSRPLNFQGRLIDGIAGEFRGGRLVRIEAASEDDRDLLAALLAIDRGAERLGEVALVDSSSRIGRVGRVFFDTLLDENAGAHIALGGGFANTRTAGAPRVNNSSLHLDVTIGTDDFEATGIAARGRRVPLIADGAWTI